MGSALRVKVATFTQNISEAVTDEYGSGSGDDEDYPGEEGEEGEDYPDGSGDVP